MLVLQVLVVMAVLVLLVVFVVLIVLIVLGGFVVLVCTRCMFNTCRTNRIRLIRSISRTRSVKHGAFLVVTCVATTLK